MKRETVAGAWIIEGAIAMLVILLLGRALGWAMTWWPLGIVSFAAGYALVALFHLLNRSRSRGPDPAD